MFSFFPEKRGITGLPPNKKNVRICGLSLLRSCEKQRKMLNKAKRRLAQMTELEIMQRAKMYLDTLVLGDLSVRNGQKRDFRCSAKPHTGDLL